jgi:hypothetical protein
MKIKMLACRSASGPDANLQSADGTRRIHPTIGPIQYQWRGVTVRRTSAPHELWLFMKAAEFARGLSGEAHVRLDGLLRRTVGVQVMAPKLARPITRHDFALAVA